MSEQLPLLSVEAALPALTERQAYAYEYVLRSRDGMSAEELGPYMHARRGKHDATERCEWCDSEGRSVLTELRRKGLVVRRRNGKWQCKNAGQVGEQAVTSDANRQRDLVPAPYDPTTAEIPF